jgi:hypothetical protein
VSTHFRYFCSHGGMADTADLKSAAFGRAGSNPAVSTGLCLVGYALSWFESNMRPSDVEDLYRSLMLRPMSRWPNRARHQVTNEPAHWCVVVSAKHKC